MLDFVTIMMVLIKKKEVIDYFNENYFGEEKEENLELFILHVILENINDIITTYDEICTTFDELSELISEEELKNILWFIDYLKEMIAIKEEQEELDFLSSENKYKILFSGFSYKDIMQLDSRTKKTLINKLSGPLSQNDVIPLSESIDHVKDAYGFPISRVHLSKDYRIAYLRKENVTVIFGVTMKTGKDIDYTRYDNIAKRIDIIYKEIEMFLNGDMPQNSEHFQIVEHLKECIKKNR